MSGHWYWHCWPQMDKNSCRGSHLCLTSEQIVPFPLPGAPSTQTMGGISGNALEGAFPAPAPRLPTGKGAMVWQCTGTTYHEENGNKICWAYLVQTKILCSWTELVSDQHITNYIIWIWPDWRLKAFADKIKPRHSEPLPRSASTTDVVMRDPAIEIPFATNYSP